MVSIVLTLIVIGFLLYLANAYIPMQPMIRNILNFVVVILVVLWLLNVFGVLTGVGVPHL